MGKGCRRQLAALLGDHAETRLGGAEAEAAAAVVLARQAHGAVLLGRSTCCSACFRGHGTAFFDKLRFQGLVIYVLKKVFSNGGRTAHFRREIEGDHGALL